MANATFQFNNCSEIVDLDHPDNSNNDQLPLDVLKAKIKCQIDAFNLRILPFTTLVQGLLYYGTTVIVCVGLFFNAVSFVVLTRKRMRKSSVNMFLTALTISDSLSLTMNFMIGVTRAQNFSANQSFMDNQSLCKLHGVFVVVFNLLSVWTIVSFTIARFLIVKYPHKAKKFTEKRTLIIIASVWLAVIMFSCHKIFIAGFEGDSVFGYKGCQTDRLRVPDIGKFYVAFNTWLPSLLILTLNVFIIRMIRKQNVRRQTMIQSTNLTTSRLDVKATKVLLTVSFTYFVLRSPLGIIQTLELFWDNTVHATPLVDPLYVFNCLIKIQLKWIRAFFFFFYQLNFAVIFFLNVFVSAHKMFQRTLLDVIGVKFKDTSPEPQVALPMGSNAVAPLSQRAEAK
ncbi:rhodopsin-like [Liolophura sinensis]|uniref:rhodopsin-like n=1 Tax=Liolophura sinensis TaxID=3198878 RepID=UPI00315902EA